MTVHSTTRAIRMTERNSLYRVPSRQSGNLRSFIPTRVRDFAYGPGTSANVPIWSQCRMTIFKISYMFMCPAWVRNKPLTEQTRRRRFSINRQRIRLSRLIRRKGASPTIGTHTSSSRPRGPRR
ncbi:hypothetical protein FDG2_0251 [Candidatus Protofrankia californiensis]|uniref:Uncharacterized protein n=1 Tax=Candidatus Protofrankia californiensis TaxID=1839754 RepID=A0A1C3NT61_9ACTN|nr:hypothetical protein FDG2_0251 [Candidatus Protofrankia californiensis]